MKHFTSSEGVTAIARFARLCPDVDLSGVTLYQSLDTGKWYATTRLHVCEEDSAYDALMGLYLNKWL
jgi:hypothetical protein